MHRIAKPAACGLTAAVALWLAACGSSQPVAGGSAFAYPPPQNFNYDIPVQPDSPWPEFRHDRYNTANSNVAAQYYGDQPWAFRTGKGIFSPPILDAAGTAYFGSADQSFYAVGVNGQELWSFPTDGIFDSGGVIGAWDPANQTYPITVGDGAADAYMFHLRSQPGLSPEDRVIWKYLSVPVKNAAQTVNWWEGHAVLGPDDTIYAGNTGGGAYAINPDGTLKWQYDDQDTVWTIPPILDDGSTYWGTLEVQQFSLGSSGNLRWTQPTVGFNTSSFMRGSDGTVYAGSFDHNFYARDTLLGLPLWSYQTNDLIYAAAAESFDASGNTTAVYIPSADGMLYALTPSGKLLWKYDSGDPIRSSPAVGRAPAGESRDIVYFGSSNGKLYALDADTGARRWSFDTTLYDDPILVDRNDLNSSPALGMTGVYIGSESGDLWYVPYDWCLHASDPRCETAPGSDFPADETATYFVTAGGNTQLDTAQVNAIPAAAVMDARLVVRSGANTGNAAFAPSLLGGAASLVTASPAFDFSASLSGDGKYLFIHPSGILAPDTDYTLRLSGSYSENLGLANAANQPPPGVALKSLAYSAPSLLQGGSVTAALDLSGAGSYPAARHLLGILLVDESSGQPVPIDYHSNLTETQDANGNLVGATLAIPARTTMPASMSVYVMTDVYPFFERSGVTGAFVQ